MAEQNGTPISCAMSRTVNEGFQPRLGKVGRDNEDDIVEGIVLLQKDEQSLRR